MVSADSSTSPAPGRLHPQLIIHPTLNLRPLFLIDAARHGAPPQPVTPPQGPPSSQSISPSSTSRSIYRQVHLWTWLYPWPVQQPASPSFSLHPPQPSLCAASSKATPPNPPVSLTSTARVRPHQADELRQSETNADPDTVSHLPRRPHGAIIAREKFLAEPAFRLRAAGAWRRALSEAMVPGHDPWPCQCPFEAQTYLGRATPPVPPATAAAAPLGS